MRKRHLDDAAYSDLRQRVLQRDRWTCQDCGSHTNLEVHHQEFRSHGGTDDGQNLITLCHLCHSRRHHAQGTREIAES